MRHGDVDLGPAAKLDPAPARAPVGWLFYDGQCAFCRKWLARIQPALMRHGYQAAALQTDWVRRRLTLSMRVDENALMSQAWLITPEGRLLGGADAALHIAALIPWLWPLRVLAALPGGKALIAAGYRRIAARRYCYAGACSMGKPTRHWPGYVPLVALPLAVLPWQAQLPPWVFMWFVALAVYVGCKWMTWWRAAAMRHGAPWSRSLAYLLAWPGMDATTFLDPRRQALRPRFTDWLAAVAKTSFGALLLFGVARLLPTTQPLAAGWVGMIGVIFLLHFGLFHLLALGWRSAGVDVTPIMRNPAAATSVRSFWGERWNVAFNRLALEGVFRPLHRRLGAAGAMFAVFVFSGLVHDVVISLPARGGYGLPTAYFLFQGVALLFEKSRFGRSIGLGCGGRGWLFSAACVVGPAYLLFHPPFVERVILPFMHAIGAL